jgi:phage tail sheath protein FI
MPEETSSYLNRKTPGVYINETSAFPTSIIGVATAVPVFIGYTQFAGDDTGKPLYSQAVPINSMATFEATFGGPFIPKFRIRAASPGTTTDPVAAAPLTISSDAVEHPFNLHASMWLFFANGGGACWVVSVGSYWEGRFPTRPEADSQRWAPGRIVAGSPMDAAEAHSLVGGIAVAGAIIGPTMIVAPEACALTDDNNAGYNTVVQAMLCQATTLQDRMAILDLPGCLTARTLSGPKGLLAGQSGLAKALSAPGLNLSFGAAYAPAVKTTLWSPGDILYTHFAARRRDTDGPGENALMNAALRREAALLYRGAPVEGLLAEIDRAFPVRGDGSPSVGPAAETAKRDQALATALPLYAAIKQQIALSLNAAPPSGMMAGVWAGNDAATGVWHAPANISLVGVSQALCAMSDEDQAGFNVPANGQATNMLRDRAGLGTWVWGARTLDGNSLDFRYISTRRTLIYVEQSVKAALQRFVFAANDAATWSSAVSLITNFLTGLWQSGGLKGAKPEDAFSVRCGVGSTMTPDDVLTGDMIVAVTLAPVRPAEFLELTFTQETQTS